MQVADVAILSNTLVPDPGQLRSAAIDPSSVCQQVVERIEKEIRGAKFADSDIPTQITIPFVFD